MADDVLRKQLHTLLAGKGAHLELAAALGDFPPELAGARVPGISHTPWRLLEHMRIAQYDILEFCRNPSYESPAWPEGYWPSEDASGDAASWKKTAAAFLDDLKQMQAYVGDPKTDLFTPLPHGTGQTVLREALLIADHNAYHLGQMILIRKAAESTSGS